MAEKIEWLILEEYAKTLKVSPQAVSKAIENGRIPPSAVRIEKSVGRGGGGQNKNVWINTKEANIAWVKTENANQGQRSEEAKERVEELRKELGLVASDNVPLVEMEKVPLAEAQRRERQAKAAMAELEFLKMQGSLVQKDVVYKQLFEAGVQLRDAIMAVPDRISSEIVAAAGNHTEIRKIITESLSSALENLTDVRSKKLG
jgi:phage terminase Nu1 subunit (DNA packaging protein)